MCHHGAGRCALSCVSLSAAPTARLPQPKPVSRPFSLSATLTPVSVSRPSTSCPSMSVSLSVPTALRPWTAIISSLCLTVSWLMSFQASRLAFFAIDSDQIRAVPPTALALVSFCATDACLAAPPTVLAPVSFCARDACLLCLRLPMLAPCDEAGGRAWRDEQRQMSTPAEIRRPIVRLNRRPRPEHGPHGVAKDTSTHAMRELGQQLGCSWTCCQDGAVVLSLAYERQRRPHPGRRGCAPPRQLRSCGGLTANSQPREVLGSEGRSGCAEVSDVLSPPSLGGRQRRPGGRGQARNMQNNRRLAR